MPALAEQAAAAPAPLLGIDHIPLAVRDLAQAAQTYRRLGFVIKPGRFHADGIRNRQIKFVDGAGIELITAATVTDTLTGRYVRLISQGEAPAFVSFHTANFEVLKTALQTLGEPYSIHDGLLEFNSEALGWLFVGAGSNRSPTDRPEHFAHPNTANATLAVWIAGGDQEQSLRLFKALGARVAQKTVRVPDPQVATVATVAGGGEVIFLPASRQVIPGRPIVGIVFRTRDLSAALRVLHSAGVAGPKSIETPTYRSLFVEPRDTHGVWLEFRQTRG